LPPGGLAEGGGPKALLTMSAFFCAARTFASAFSLGVVFFMAVTSTHLD
jgi:hypothetical protein